MQEMTTRATVNRVAIVSAVNPYPVSSGKDVVLAGIVDYWREQVGADAVHYLLVRPESEAAPTGFPVPVHRLPAASGLRKMASVATRALPGRSSLQEAILFDPALGRHLAGAIDTLDVDLVIFDTVRLGQYVDFLPPRPGRRHLVYLDDLFSLRYTAMLRTLSEHGNVDVDALGQFRAFIPQPLQPLAASRTVQQGLLRWERRAIDRAERASVGHFDRVLLINALEAEHLRQQTGATNVACLPPLLPLTTRPRPRYDGRPEFVFLGQLSIPHNDDGITWFLDHAMEPLLTLLPEAHLRIIGRDPRPGLEDKVRRFGQHVTLEGYVPDLDGALGRAAALISPLRFGSGVKIKLVEALARALPSVTTSTGAHGVVADGRSGVIVEDDIAAYPEILLGLTDPRRNRTISTQAHRHFEETFSREAVLRSYDAIFQPSAERARRLRRAHVVA